MTHLTKRLAAVAALCLVALPASADNYTVKDAGGAVKTFRGKQLSPGLDGVAPVLPLNGMVDPTTGLPFSPANPLLVAPGIAAVTPTDRGVTITTGGTAVQAMAANANRKAGWCVSSSANTGIVQYSLTATATVTPGTPNSGELVPTGTLNLVQNGYVYQGAVSVNSSVSGTVLSCVEFQ